VSVIGHRSVHRQVFPLTNVSETKIDECKIKRMQIVTRVPFCHQPRERPTPKSALLLVRSNSLCRRAIKLMGTKSWTRNMNAPVGIKKNGLRACAHVWRCTVGVAVMVCDDVDDGEVGAAHVEHA
jgi:hypothetical protein